MQSFFRAAVPILVFLAAAGGASPADAGRYAFWACSDGAGTVLLYWLPEDGEWPEGGFRLERVSGKRTTLLAQNILPGQDEDAMSSIDPWDAVDIRILAERIRYGTMTDEERYDSVTVLGRNAALDIAYGRALGVRHADRTRESGAVRYRLTAVAGDGSPLDSAASNEVYPMKATPGPQWPSGLRAEARDGGIALFWEEPRKGDSPPVVAYRIGRGMPGGKSPSLTKKPVERFRGSDPGDPAFLDANPPKGIFVYQVQGVDLFARTSPPARVQVTAGAAPPSPAPAPSPSPSPEPETPYPSFDLSRSRESIPFPELVPRSRHAGSGPGLSGSSPVAEKEPVRDGGEGNLYRRMLKDSEIGIPIPYRSPREARPAPAEPLSPPPAESPRTLEEQERIDLYRKAAEAEESGEIPPIPLLPASPGPPPPAIQPSPRGTDDPLPTLEELRRIDMYRRLAEGKAPAPWDPLSDTSDSPAATPEPAAPPPAPEIRRAPDEEERIETYRRMAEDSEQGAEVAAADVPLLPEDYPPTPVIDSIRIAEGKVSIGFFPGGPSCPSCEFLVLRSEDRGNPGISTAGSLPTGSRSWTDAGAEPGKSYWYRIVAIDGEGRRSSPSAARWIQVPDR